MDSRDSNVRDDVIRQLEPLPVTARNMFGGAGLYLEGQYFGFISDGVLYFRTDASSRAAYLERGMSAFQPASRPRGPKTVDRNFRVPDEVLRDPSMLTAWATTAAATVR
jgi:DNA transformation protein